MDMVKKIKNLPDSPGVYLFLDDKGRVIYVGKAKRLKQRVASYFRRGKVRHARLELLVSKIRDIRIVRASSEAEALIYEAGLIKDHRPKFNIELRDDKSYPFLKLTLNEEYPRLFLTRGKLADDAAYYGPYVDVKLLKEALSFMKKVFPLRSCRRLHKKVCLEYHIGQCPGPCCGKVTKKEYSRPLGQLVAFLEGRKDDLIRSLENDMRVFSREKEYEKALVVKRRVAALTAVQQLHDRSARPMFGELEELQNTLAMTAPPVVIECFDISNTGGTQAAGSMVKFVAGKPDRAGYRRFRIKNVIGANDYSMIREVVRRRYTRLSRDGGRFPDLVIIDGGRGHLSSAEAELRDLGLKQITVVAIAKEFNHLYTRSRKQPIRLSPGSRLLLLIQRVRDEAHRVAIEYHRKLRQKKAFESGLREIKGIGEARERRLMEKFGTLNNIRKATVEEIKEAGIARAAALAVVKSFQLKADS